VVDYRKVVETARLVVDTRNATAGLVGQQIVRLSGPYPFQRRTGQVAATPLTPA
jgi:hypothetical protein